MFSDLSDSQSIMISVPGTPGHAGPWPGPAGTISGRFEKKGVTGRARHGGRVCVGCHDSFPVAGPVHEAFSKHLGSGCIRTARSAPMALRRSAAGAREAWEATSGNLESQIGYEVFSQFEYNRSLNASKKLHAQGWAYGIPLIRAYNIVRPRELGVLPRSPTRTPAERRYGISFCFPARHK